MRSQAQVQAPPNTGFVFSIVGALKKNTIGKIRLKSSVDTVEKYVRDRFGTVDNPKKPIIFDHDDPNFNANDPAYVDAMTYHPGEGPLGGDQWGATGDFLWQLPMEETEQRGIYMKLSGEEEVRQLIWDNPGLTDRELVAVFQGWDANEVDQETMDRFKQPFEEAWAREIETFQQERDLGQAIGVLEEAGVDEAAQLRSAVRSGDIEMQPMGESKKTDDPDPDLYDGDSDIEDPDGDEKAGEPEETQKGLSPEEGDFLDETNLDPDTRPGVYTEEEAGMRFDELWESNQSAVKSEFARAVEMGEIGNSKLGQEVLKVLPEEALGINPGVGGEAGAFVSKSRLKQWVEHQEANLFNLPVMFGINKLLDVADPSGQASDWVNLGLASFDMLMSGDPTGLIMYGIGELANELSTQANRKIENDNPYATRASQFGKVRVGNQWFPAFFDHKFEQTAFGDRDMGWTAQYGEQLVFQRTHDGKVQPFFLDQKEINYQDPDYVFTDQYDDIPISSKEYLDRFDPLRSWYFLTDDEVRDLSKTTNVDGWDDFLATETVDKSDWKAWRTNLDDYDRVLRATDQYIFQQQ